MSNEWADHPQPRNDNNQRQIGVGGGNQMIPLANNPPPPSPPTARRILVIQRYNDVVDVLSDFSISFRQPIYILSGIGNVSQVVMTTLPSLQQIRPHDYDVGHIRYLSGWFQPLMMNTSAAPFLVSRPNGILHVAVSNSAVSIANWLMVYGCVEVCIVLFCGPGSVIPPDAPGALPLQITIPEAEI